MNGGQLSGVSKRFSRRGRWVLRQADLEMRPGSRTVIVGGNGSGKSTLLRIVAGVTQPTAGTVSAPKAIGYVPERLAARSKLTGAEYIAHMGRIKGLGSEGLRSRSRELFDRLDLQPGPTVMIDSLSKGNKQKIVLAQAFLGFVELLVLDEPFSGLDAPAHHALGELIDEARATGTSVLISAHRADPRVVADQTIQISDGRLKPLTDPPPGTFTLNRNEQRIELMATPDAAGHDQIAGLLGVHSLRHDALGMTVSLVVDRSHTDVILSAVIRMGWSVQSVGAPGDNGGSR
jgi:ABC-type multidrug transport system ATPase subunit